MITLRRLASPRDKKTLFEDFDSSHQSWIVGDATSKRQLQNNLLSKRGFIEDECVLSSNDLWCLLLRRLRPDFEIVSKDLARVIVAEYLKERDFEWARTPGAAMMACRYIKYLMPILSHPHGEEVIEAWFQENPDAQNRWGHWFHESTFLWKQFSQSKIVSIDWVAGFLVNESGFEDVWVRDLIFDVGPGLLSVEAELLSVMSRNLNVDVIEPAPPWQDEFERNFAGYKFIKALENIEVVESESPETPVTSEPLKARHLKMTTMLAEVKQATATIRAWLERGIRPHDISIFAPDMNIYWPVLRPYLREEGVPVRRKHASPLSIFPEISQWFSRLKIGVGQVTIGNLETVLFSGGSAQAISFEKFKILFGVIYGDEDLNRSKEIFDLLKSSRISSNEVMTRDRFLIWAMSLWNEHHSFERLQKLLENFLPSGPASLKLPVSSWIEHLMETSVQESAHVTLKEGDADGIICSDLAASEHIFSRHTILIGITERALRRDEPVSILPKDIFSLHQSLGFNLPVLEDSKSEFEARWLFEDREREFVVTTPMTDFKGDVETPALLWITGASAQREDDEVLVAETSVPELTRWDEIQEVGALSSIAQHHDWTSERQSRVVRSIEQDRGERELSLFGGDLVQSLSASGVEDYLNCPFVFASKRLFKLSDLPSIDLDLDHMTKGKLIHALFESLTQEPMRFQLSDSEIEKLIEACVEREKIILGDPRMWPSMRRRYLGIARKFIEFEQEWRKRFPKTKTVGRELQVRGVLTPMAQFVSEGQGLAFRGSIDRVDTDGEGHAVIIDYKSTKSAAVTHHNKWLDNNVMQLLLYSMAVENGLSELGPQEVIGALYFVARDLTREHGFMLPEYNGLLFETKSRMKHGLSLEQKQELFGLAQEKLKGIYSEIKKGAMHPHPFDEADCRSCQWRTLCRSPHLL